MNFSNKIEIKNVSYTFPSKKLPVIENFSLTVNKGDFIGVIGKSGKGKSTILDLIMGLLKLNGEILVDNKNIFENLNGWQQNIGFVSQSTNLLDESIKNNIAFGILDEDIDKKKLVEASKDSQIFEFISALPNKFETQVGDRGITLSGGQKQRIGIVREFYRNPPIIVLDEATSALDLDTEKEFLKCLDKLKGLKTLIFVSHRKSALESCDKILDLDNMFNKDLLQNLKLLFNAKFEIKPPPCRDIVIYDHGLDQLEFKKNECYVLHTRGEKINLFILIKLF